MDEDEAIARIQAATARNNIVVAAATKVDETYLRNWKRYKSCIDTSIAQGLLPQRVGPYINPTTTQSGGIFRRAKSLILTPILLLR